MSTEVLNSLMKQIKSMSIEDQRTLNSLLCANIRGASKIRSIQSAAKFVIGDTVVFNAKTRGMITISVDGFSRDMSKIKGTQLNQGCSSNKGMKWTVGASLCKAASAV